MVPTQQHNISHTRKVRSLQQVIIHNPFSEISLIRNWYSTKSFEDSLKLTSISHIRKVRSLQPTTRHHTLSHSAKYQEISFIKELVDIRQNWPTVHLTSNAHPKIGRSLFLSNHRWNFHSETCVQSSIVWRDRFFWCMHQWCKMVCPGWLLAEAF
jgi:hypothetical protein